MVPIRRVAASGLVAVGVLAALFAGVFRYVDGHFHTPENFVEATSTLADNADVRERLFEGFRTEVIALADGRDLAAEAAAEAAEADDEADADDADEDAVDDEAGSTDDELGPVTDERNARDEAIEEILLDAFDSDVYRSMFTDQLESVQSQLIRSAELPDGALLRDSGQVNFDARPLYGPIYEALRADERTTAITQNEIPPTYGIYSIGDRETTVNAAWWLIENGPNWRGLATALAVVSFIAMLVIAERRPSRMIQFGLGLVGLALVVVVVVYIVRAIVPLLAGGGGSGGAVVAVYAATLSPLISIMWRLMILGIGIAVVGGIAKLIWPDDWVYGHVSDDRGPRSIRRRRGTPEVQAQPQQPQPQQVPVAAGVPVAYPPYGYPAPGWGGQPYPGQPYAAAPPYGYPAGPYAQPMPAGLSPQTGRPTVPVQMTPSTSPAELATGETPIVVPDTPPVANGSAPSAADTMGATGNGIVGRPADAAQAVPRVVASASPDLAKPTDDDPDTEPAVAAVAPTPDVPEAPAPATPSGAKSTVVEGIVVPGMPESSDDDDDDDWASDGDW